MSAAQTTTTPGLTLRLAQAAWITFVTLSIGLYVLGGIVYFRDLETICTASKLECHDRGLATPEDVVQLQAEGVMLRDWAIANTAYRVVFSSFFCTVGFLIFARKRNEWNGLLFSLFLISFGTISQNQSALIENYPAIALLVKIVTYPAYITVALFFATFPNGRIVPRVMWIPLALWSLYFFLDLFVGWIPRSSSLWDIMAATAWLGMFGSGAAAQAYRYLRVSNEQERRQTKWVVFGIAVLVTSILIMSFSPLGSQFDTNVTYSRRSLAVLIGFNLLLTIIPLTIGIAILRYRLFDIDIIINRALVYGTLTTLVIGLYIFVVGYLGAIFRTQTNLGISLAATGVVAVLFQPLRDWLQRGVNRLMYGQRDEPVAVLSQLGARLEATLAPDEILPGLVDTVAQTLKLPYAAVALQVGDQLKVQAESGQASGPLETFPLIYQGQPIGQLQVAPRSPGEAFNPADRLLLTNIARQAGAVAHAVQLTAALQQSRQQLVTAREEERRRLRRDLHDGLGPQLASQTLTLNAIGKLLDRDPPQARELLTHLQAQSQAAIEDIRRLVYALRPPALDELGLTAALQESTRQYEQTGGHIEITTDPQPLPVLPAAVEVAVYRIAQEAMTNVIRHAQAKQCRVAITVQDHHLDLTIADDGPGFPSNVHFGVGLNSMRERAEELGGYLHFENQPQGGAQVKLWLPLPGDEA